MEQPPVPALPTHLAPSQKGFGGVADPNQTIYEMLHLDPLAQLAQIEEGLHKAQRWWNAQQANPKYRRQAGEALARLREARGILLDPIRRQEYDRQLQQFRQLYRARQWQPIRDLLDVLLDDQLCTHPQHMLIRKFAAKRGLTEDEIDTFLSEELLKREIRLQAPPEPKQAVTRRTLQPAHVGILGLMALSLLGLLILPWFDMSRPAVLLAFPFFNNVRLMMRLLETPNTNQPSQTTNGWDWLVGTAVLGGATVTALLELHHTTMFPLGFATAILLWLSWGWLAQQIK